MPPPSEKRLVLVGLIINYCKLLCSETDTWFSMLQKPHRVIFGMQSQNWSAGFQLKSAENWIPVGVLKKEEREREKETKTLGEKKAVLCTGLMSLYGFCTC